WRRWPRGWLRGPWPSRPSTPTAPCRTGRDLPRNPLPPGRRDLHALVDLPPAHAARSPASASGRARCAARPRTSRSAPVNACAAVRRTAFDALESSDDVEGEDARSPRLDLVVRCGRRGVRGVGDVAVDRDLL